MSTALRIDASRWRESYPFISFSFAVTALHASTLATLGECSSKIEHISGVPLLPEVAREMYQIFLVKGVRGTTAIEGNTLSEDQVRERLAGSLDLPKSQEYLGEEVDNIVKAYQWLMTQNLHNEPPAWCAEDLKGLNATVLAGLSLNDGVVPGEFRQRRVTVGDYLSPEGDCTVELVDRLCQWLNSSEWEQSLGPRFVVPVLKSILAHLYLAWIHPFGDGNGRTARLLEFDILTRAGVPPMSAHLLSDHYNLTRTAYYQALSRARNDASVFVSYAVNGFVDGLRDQLKRIRKQQLEVAWTNFVHDRFKAEPHTQATTRRRNIAILLAAQAGPVHWTEIRRLTPEIAHDYVGATAKKVMRDMNALCDMDLVYDTGEGEFMAKTEQVLAFLPVASKARDAGRRAERGDAHKTSDARAREASQKAGGRP